VGDEIAGHVNASLNGQLQAALNDSLDIVVRQVLIQ